MRVLERFSIIFILIGICAFMAFSTRAFLSSQNLFNILLQVSINTIVAVGMTFVILTAGIDLSVGSVVALVAVTVGTALHAHCGTFLSIVIGLGAGVVCGTVSG